MSFIFLFVPIGFWCHLTTSDTNYIDFVSLMVITNHPWLLRPLLTAQSLISSVVFHRDFVPACRPSPSPFVCLRRCSTSSPRSRVSSVEGWRAQSRGPRVSPNWTELAVSATWSSPASAVQTKTGQWVCVSDFMQSCWVVWGCLATAVWCHIHIRNLYVYLWCKLWCLHLRFALR